jgi:hypothetical protein
MCAFGNSAAGPITFHQNVLAKHDRYPSKSACQAACALQCPCITAYGLCQDMQKSRPLRMHGKQGLNTPQREASTTAQVTFGTGHLPTASIGYQCVHRRGNKRFVQMHQLARSYCVESSHHSHGAQLLPHVQMQGGVAAENEGEPSRGGVFGQSAAQLSKSSAPGGPDRQSCALRTSPALASLKP